LSRLFGRFTRGSGLRRVAENVSWLFVERVLMLALNFAVSVWFINYLGPESYGRYSYAVSFVALFAVLASLGLDVIVIRELSQESTDHGEILGTAFMMRVGSSLLTVALVIGSVFLTSADALTRMLVVVVALSIFADPAQVVDLWFQSRIESKFMVLLRSGVALVGIVARVALILGGMSLIAFAWLYAAQALAIGAGALALFALRRPAGLALRASGRRARWLLAESWPLIVAGVSVTIYMKIDRVMLGEMLDERAVGTYSTAATLSEIGNFLPVAIAASLFPIVVRSRESAEPGLYDRRMQALYDVMALIGYAIALVMTLFGVPLINLLFTRDFGEAAGILQIHVWSLVFVALGGARSRFLIAEHRVRFAMVATLTGALLNVLLNLWLIPRMGGEGAALATVLSYSVAAYFSSLFVRDLWPTAGQMTRALLAPLRPRAVWREIRAIL